MATCRLIEMNGRHEKGAAGQATPFDIPVTSPVRRTGDGRSVGLGLEIDGRVLAATIDFQFEVQTVTLVQGAHAGAFDSADVDESVRLAVITLDEAEALHGVEELDRAAGAFAGQLTLRATLCTTETTGAGLARFTRRRTIGHGERFAVDDQIGRRHLATTIHQGEAERLTFGQTGQAGLLDRADVNEHVFAAIVTNDEAETLLAVEELDDTLAFANDLGRHAATTAAAATKAATAAAEATAATAAETAAAAEATAITTAEATTTTITTAEAATEAAAVTKATAAEAAAAALVVEIVVAETVALVLAAPAAAPSVKTHALLVTFASPQDTLDKHVGRMTCTIHRKVAVWESLYQVFRAARMISHIGQKERPQRRFTGPICQSLDCDMARFPIEGKVMTVHFHEEDLPEGVLAPGPIAVDTETMGLITPRDRLCVVQISDGKGDEHLVRFNPGSDYAAPNLKAVLADPERIKIYHFGRFDIAAIQHYLGVVAAPVYCTKIASKLVRTYTDRHGLKELVRELLGQDISKQQQSSDWGGPNLSDAQKDYAASDVRFLHQLKTELDKRLTREGRMELAQACFDFLPHRAALDLAGWPENDIFSHM